MILNYDKFPPGNDWIYNSIVKSAILSPKKACLPPKVGKDYCNEAGLIEIEGLVFEETSM